MELVLAILWTCGIIIEGIMYKCKVDCHEEITFTDNASISLTFILFILSWCRFFF